MFTTQDFRREHPDTVAARFVRPFTSRMARSPERFQRRNTLIAKLNPAPSSDWMRQVLDLKLPARPFGSKRLTRCDACHSSGRIAGEGTNGNEP